MILLAVACLFIGGLLGYLLSEQHSRARLIHKVEIEVNSNQDPQKFAKAVHNHFLKVVK